MSLSFEPIASWPVVLVAAVLVMILTLWAYRQRLRGTSGRWRWFALGLRLAAVLLCFVAALRPSVVVQEKTKQPSSLVFLSDGSTSMQLTDEAGGKSRWESARRTLEQARPAAKRLGPNLDVRYYRFDSSLREESADDKAEPEGRSTQMGSAMLEAVKRQVGRQVAAVVLLSDGANNAGLNPLVEARRLRSQQVPIIAVGFGSENAGPASRDISVRDLVAGPTVFVKHQLQLRGALVVRGFPNQPIDVELFVEGQNDPVAKTRLKVPEGSEVVPITGLKYIPQTPGEKKLTLRVKPKEGELIRTNNEVSTFISVLSGGLNVLLVQGPHSPWEHKFLSRALDSSPDIQAEDWVLRKPAEGDKGELDDKEFALGKYNVYILSDLAASFLTPRQQQMLTAAVEKGGAGLIMLGGRSSFGPGGWADTPVARILPVSIHPGDGQLEPDGGVKFYPRTGGIENYIFQVSPDRAESRKIWQTLPPLTGANRFGTPKADAVVLADTGGPRPEPLMVAGSPGSGRVLAFGGETWVWVRSSEIGVAAHRKFWRQVIFWLAHKENQGDEKVNLALDARRIALGEKLGIEVTARDAKDQPLSGVEYETKVTREGAKTPPEPIQVYADGDKARGSFLAIGEPGVYEVKVTGRREGKEIGSDHARFLVYQDDREMENPAADLALMRQIAETTGGQFLPPEGLIKYLKSLDGKITTESLTQVEHKIWDNWPFLLIFTALLTLEWWLRKRHGWV
jgi:uncharacterized membrane protein